MGIVLVLLACVTVEEFGRVPTSTPLPTLSRTPKPTRSPTPAPTTTRRPPATLTPAGGRTAIPSSTATSLSPFPTRTERRELDCKLDWQSPGSGIAYRRDVEFSAGWKVTNTGTATWDAESVEFTYLAGAKLHVYPLVELESSVAPGQAVILTAEMKAPRNPSRYTTYWGLRQGDTFFCRLELTIRVR